MSQNDNTTPISEEEIRKILRGHNPVRIEWSQSDSIDKETVTRLVEKGIIGKEEFEGELENLNHQNFQEIRDNIIKEVLKDLFLRSFEGEPDPSDEEAHETYRRETIERLSEEELTDDVNLKGLARSSGKGYFTIRRGEDISYQSYIGITHYSQVEEFLTILNISPHHYQDLVSKESSDLVLPEIPERNGNEYVDPAKFRGVLEESMYGGELAFFCQMSYSDLLDDLEALTKGSIRIYKGTPVTLHDYTNGATAMAEAFLIRDMDVPAGKFSLHFDEGDRLGIQSCCDMTDVLWKKGHVLAELPKQG